MRKDDFFFEKMDRLQSERIGAQFMELALDNLMRDGYAAFATLLIRHDGSRQAYGRTPG